MIHKAHSLESIASLKCLATLTDVTMGRILTDCMRRDGVPRSLTDEQKVQLKRFRNLVERALAELPTDDQARTYIF